MNKIETNYRNFYIKNGYLKISKIFTNKEISLLKKYVADIEKLEPRKKKFMIYYDTLGKKKNYDKNRKFFTVS